MHNVQNPDTKFMSNNGIVVGINKLNAYKIVDTIVHIDQ